jgi:hypothetical protein
MSPFIKSGDVITVAPSSRKPKAPAYGIGQVVAFVIPVYQRLVVHRIVVRRGSRFLIQGDNSPGLDDGMIHRDDILGRVVRVERGRKRIRFGLGPERYAIAVLSRAGLLPPILSRVVALTRFLRKPTNEDN